MAGSDSDLAVLGPGVVAAVATAAPRASLAFRTLDKRVVTDPMALLRTSTCSSLPRGPFALPEVPSMELYRDRWVCARWRCNGAVGDRLSLDYVTRAR